MKKFSYKAEIMYICSNKINIDANMALFAGIIVICSCFAVIISTL